LTGSTSRSSPEYGYGFGFWDQNWVVGPSGGAPGINATLQIDALLGYASEP
jgi:hypothetical protein